MLEDLEQVYGQVCLTGIAQALVADLQTKSGWKWRAVGSTSGPITRTAGRGYYAKQSDPNLTPPNFGKSVECL